MYSVIRKLNRIGNNFRWFEVSLLRILVGGFIIYKGITFSQHTDMLVELIEPVNANAANLFVAHYVVIGHIAGGLMILTGLLTRIAAAVQLPVLVGAVIANAYIGDGSQLILSILVLISLVFITIVGSGKMSVDYTLKLHI